MNYLPFVVLTCFIACGAFGGESVAQTPPIDRRELFKKLHDPAQAEDAFAALATNAPVDKNARQYLFTAATPVFITQLSGSEIAAVQLSFLHQLRCGNGIYDGGVEPPKFLSELPSPEELIILEESGRPRMIVNSIWNMAVHDAVGDRRTAELIRWSSYTDCDQPPFLIIHDLSQPEFPTMLNLVFNPHMTEWDHHMIVRDKDGNLIVRTHDESDPPATPPHATRFSRWFFVPQKDSKLNDIVIEEKKGEKFQEVARFIFDPKARRWNGPKGGDDEIWKIGADDHDRASFSTNMRLETNKIYRKYDPKAELERDAKAEKSKKIEDE